MFLLPFPMGGVDGLSRNFHDLEGGGFTAGQVAKFDLDALREAVVEDFSESDGIPAGQL